MDHLYLKVVCLTQQYFHNKQGFMAWLITAYLKKFEIDVTIFERQAILSTYDPYIVL